MAQMAKSMSFGGRNRSRWGRSGGGGSSGGRDRGGRDRGGRDRDRDRGGRSRWGDKSEDRGSGLGGGLGSGLGSGLGGGLGGGLGSGRSTRFSDIPLSASFLRGGTTGGSSGNNGLMQGNTGGGGLGAPAGGGGLGSSPSLLGAQPGLGQSHQSQPSSQPALHQSGLGGNLNPPSLLSSKVTPPSYYQQSNTQGMAAPSNGINNYGAYNQYQQPAVNGYGYHGGKN